MKGVANVKKNYRIHLSGDCCVTVEFDGGISPAVYRLVSALDTLLCSNPIPGITECVPSYSSVTVYYDPLQISCRSLISALTARLKKTKVTADSRKKRVLHIPVCYGGAYGPDLDSTASFLGLEAEELIHLHTESEYLIYMLGFLPGFAYLGGLNPKLEAPRLETPRVLIPAGSVGIGGNQTGIYPLDSPGGWRLIGRTPLRPYDQQRKKPFLYEAGEFVRFQPVSSGEYQKIEAQIADGSYLYVVEE